VNRPFSARAATVGIEIAESYDEDLQLMRRVAAGDRSAQRDLVGRLAPRARRVSLALLRDAADADDAAQCALIAVLESARGYHGKASIERWADRIVARTAIRLARKKRGGPAGDDDLEAEAPPSTEGAGLDARRYLESLPPPQRTALVLRHVMECSIEEIAEETNVSVNTVKDRLVRALARVREMARTS